MKYRLGYDDARLSSACALRPFSELLSLCYPVACGSSSRLQKIVNSNERTVTKRRGLGRNGTRSTLPTIGYGGNVLDLPAPPRAPFREALSQDARSMDQGLEASPG